MRTLLVALALAAPAQAQIFDVGVRYELGQRLRLFEQALEKHRGDKKAVARAIPPVAAATPAFFGGRLTDAAEILDKARLTLESEKPSEAALWASSWRFVPKRRVGDAKKGKIELEIERFYKTTAKAPPKYSVVAGIVLKAGSPGIGTFELGVAAMPRKLDLLWEDEAEGDYSLQWHVGTKTRPLLVGTIQTVSLVNDLDARLKKLEKSDVLGKKTVEAATLAHHLGVLKTLAKGQPLETDYPAHRLLVEAEAIAAGKWDNKKPGQYWLGLPGVGGSPVRVQVPKEIAGGKPLPVVVAMHGAGGSENMFFDGYGDGLVAKLAAERGWLVVATRSPVLAFGGGPDVPAVLDALAKLYPIDRKKVCIVGHSMGAAQTIQAVGRDPGRFAAAAALGGGGTFRAGDGLKKVPFLVGIGEMDFLVKNAKSLDSALRKAGATTTFKEYANIEHLTIVQMALPEVFAFFDKAVK